MLRVRESEGGRQGTLIWLATCTRDVALPLRHPPEPRPHYHLQPDRMLMADQPWRARARAHIVIFCLWALLVAAAGMELSARVSELWRSRQWRCCVLPGRFLCPWAFPLLRQRYIKPSCPRPLPLLALSPSLCTARPEPHRMSTPGAYSPPHCPRFPAPTMLQLKLNDAGGFRGFDGGCDVVIADIQCAKPPLAEAGASELILLP